MTHLSATQLVSKNHPRIHFRGKLDSLEARIIALQLQAQEHGAQELLSALTEIYALSGAIMAAEVKEQALPPLKLWGLSHQDLRAESHQLFSKLGGNKAQPSYRQGRLAVALNTLRTYVRETELAAVAAFSHGEQVERTDIIAALNALSSAIHILYGRLLLENAKQGAENNE